MRTPHRRRGMLAAAAATTLLSLAACGSSESGSTGSADGSAEETAAAAAGPRLAVTHEGGVMVLDAETLQPAGDFDTEEFTRVNPAGDGRHVMLTTTEGFQVLDTAAGSDAEPELTDTVFEADTAGHVVSHAGRTVLYADGTSDTTIVPTDAIAEGEMSEAQVVEGLDAHHGVSIVLEDGTFVTTVGDSESRSGAVATAEDGTEIASSDECPGIHGEGTLSDETVVFGCEDGALLYADGEFVKVAAPDDGYARSGNMFVAEGSSLVVGDYNTDQDAEGYLLDQVAVVDTAERTYDVVDTPGGAGYTFRDIARGPEGNAYVLADDGAIHVLDPETREFVDSFPVVDAWDGPVEWQDPHPAIKVEGDIAYVTEPAARTVHAVDLTDGSVVASAELDVVPNEIAVAVG